MPTRPGDGLLDFQIETTPLVYLANLLYDDTEIPDMARVRCAAVFQVQEKAERALEEAEEDWQFIEETWPAPRAVVSWKPTAGT
jgi:hypothetical protein